MDYDVISKDLEDRLALREPQLTLEVQAGSSAAFAQLHSIYRRRLYRTVFAITKNREDTEDVLQDTFLRAFQAAGRFKGKSSVYSWLTRIAINSALMVLRRRRSRPESFLDHVFKTEDDRIPADPRDSSLNPEQLCDQREQSMHLRRAVHKLEPRLRTPIQVLLTDTHSVKEIADILNISLAAVKSRLFRARARLSTNRAFARSMNRLICTGSQIRSAAVSKD